MSEAPKGRKATICTPTYRRPHQAYLEALKVTGAALDAAGIHYSVLFGVGSPYISHARSELLRRALNANADDIVFVDHDLSWEPETLVRLIQTPGDVVAGTYRFKYEPEEYMGAHRVDDAGYPVVLDAECIAAEWIPAGFMKITKEAVDRFMRAYPELCYGPRFALSVDLFNHGAHDGQWWGEDYAFSRRWNAMGETIRLIHDLDLTHHADDGTAFPGNFSEWLQRQPGGRKDPARMADAPQLSAA